MHVATLPAESKDFQQATWKRLGSMTFDSNERSKFQARELKSVQVDVVAQLLKVVVYMPYTNELNKHQQVLGFQSYLKTMICSKRESL